MFFDLQNFKPGLDTRRYELTSVPGTLEVFTNGHVNQGGEIEKRKSFVLDQTLPANTFGAQETVNGIAIFGSASAASIGTISNGAIGTVYIYFQCIHPAVLAGTTYDPAAHAMTSVVSSTLFGNYAFVVAQFSDTSVWCYYCNNLTTGIAALMVDFTAGVILPYLNTDSLIATNIEGLLQLNSQFVNSAVNAAAGQVDIVSNVGLSYTTATDVVTTGSGAMSVIVKNQGFANIPGTQAYGQFVITAGLPGAGLNSSISSITVNGGSNLLLNGTAINFQTTIYDTAIAVANSISQNAGTSGYYAVATGNTVLIYTVVAGTSTNTYPVSVTVVSPVSASNYFATCIENCQMAISGPVGATSWGISSITVGGGSSIMNAGVTTSVSITDLVQRVAGQINVANNSYCACGNGTNLYISKKVTTSADPITAVSAPAVVVTPNTGGAYGTGVVVNQSNNGFQLSLSATSVNGVESRTKNTSGTIVADNFVFPAVNVLIGGILNAPYTYTWNLVSTTIQANNSKTGSPLATYTFAQLGLDDLINLPTTNTQQAQVVCDAGSVLYLLSVGSSIGQTYPWFSATYFCTVIDASGQNYNTGNVTFLATFAPQ